MNQACDALANLVCRSGFDELVEFFGQPTEANNAPPTIDYHGRQWDNGAEGRLLEKIGLKYVAVQNPLEK